MKGNTIAAFLSMLLLVVYPLVLDIQTDASNDLARFIPENAMVYFEQRNGSNALKEFTKSPLGKKIETINFIQTGREVGVAESVLSSIEEIVSYYNSAKDNKLLHEVLGKKFALAILSPEEIQVHANFLDYLKKNTVVFAKPVHSVEELEFFAESYGKVVQTYSISSAQYGNYHIKRIKFSSITTYRRNI